MKSVWLVSILALAGCASAPLPEPVRLRTTDLGTLDDAQRAELAKGRPLVIEIHEGEVIPFDVTIGGDLVSTAAGTTIALTAKRNFFLRITKDGLAVSRDGEHFGTKPKVPGRFRIGVSATRERGLRGEMEVVTPQP